MTRAEVEQKIQDMHVARQRGLEAETISEERAFADQWHRLWKEVRPYIEGRARCSDEQQEAA